MVSLNGDALRSFWINHNVANINHMIWQLATTEMTCVQTSGSIPGLIATGLLPANANSFDLDFAAIFASAQGQEADQNQGTDFTLARNFMLTDQSQQFIYLCIIFYEQNDQPIASTDEVSSQLDNLNQMKNVNPFNVTYLTPATKAQYRPAYVDVKLFNQHDKRSPTGTLMVSYYPPGKPHFKIYDTMSLEIPSLGPGESTFIRVYLSPGSTELPIYQDYYKGSTSECELVVRTQYKVTDLETAAIEQKATGTSSISPNVNVYDIDPVYEYRAINKPADELFN